MTLTESPLYVVRSGTFEGPLEHLLTLVESRKLFINEISLAQVTNDYLAYVRKLPEYHLNDITGFIVVAATLILIKSRSLLPNLELTSEEEKTIVDLELRLRLYQQTKEAAQKIKESYGTRYIAPGVTRVYDSVVFSPDLRITTEYISNLIHELLEKTKPEKKLPEVAIKKMITIDEMISNLSERIAHAMTLSFKDFTAQSNSTSSDREKKVYTIVSFLALLELVREGIVDVLQDDQFTDMTISKITT